MKQDPMPEAFCKSRQFGLMAVVLSVLAPVMAGCTSSGGSSVDALESVLAEQQERQNRFAEQQKKLVEQQKALSERQREQQLALIEENRKRFQSAQALALKPSQLAESGDEPTANKPPVKKASVGGASRASGNIQLNAPWKCVPDKLKAVIREVSRRYGPVVVNSTYRSRSKNRRIGGARNSYHLRCQAIDFRVRGDGRKVLRFLRSHPHVGGLKRYRSGYFHIDTGPRRTWRG